MIIYRYNEFLNEEYDNWFSNIIEFQNRKWIKMIKNIFYHMTHRNRGIIISENDPYGEEQWEDENIDVETTSDIIFFFKNFLKFTKTENSNIERLISDLEDGSYTIKQATTLLKIIKWHLEAFYPKYMEFYKLEEDDFLPWRFANKRDGYKKWIRREGQLVYEKKIL